MLINEEHRDEPSNAVLLAELQSMKQSLGEVTALKQQVMCLSDKLDEVYKIIHQQQLFLEILDSKGQKQNLIITGVSGDPDDFGNTDNEKIDEMLQAAKYTEANKRQEWEVKRLGKPNERKMRPLLIVVTDQKERDIILTKAKKLKKAGNHLSKVYLKKDVHPAVRRENARLRKREREEKEKPENVGVNISFDWKDRVLLRDGAIIVRFLPQLLQTLTPSLILICAHGTSVALEVNFKNQKYCHSYQNMT